MSACVEAVPTASNAPALVAVLGLRGVTHGADECRTPAPGILAGAFRALLLRQLGADLKGTQRDILIDANRTRRTHFAWRSTPEPLFSKRV
jgi:hypothetical protein